MKTIPYKNLRRLFQQL